MKTLKKKLGIQYFLRNTTLIRYANGKYNLNLQMAFLLNLYGSCYDIYKICLYPTYNQPGKRGGGGEYEAQDGFGWTNGVFLFFLQEYGDKISSDDSVYGAATSWISNDSQLKYLFLVIFNVVVAQLMNI